MMCDKVKMTKREAEAALKKILSHKKRKWRREVRIYPCPHCNMMWHLTSLERGISKPVNLIHIERWQRLLA